MDDGIEFVKHFQSHLGAIVSLTANVNGNNQCAAANNKILKIFDAVNFDMINTFQWEYVSFAIE